MIENYTLITPEGAELQININGNDATITLMDTEVITRKIELKDLEINFKSLELRVNYVHTQYVNNVLMNSDEDNTLNSTEFNYFLNLPNLDGNKILKHCLNAIIYKIYNYRCFDADGVFHNYEPEPVEEPTE